MKVAIVDINGKETGRTVALDKAILVLNQMNMRCI